MKKKSYTSEFKAKVALEALKGQQTLNEIAHKFKIHPVQVSSWKKQFLENMDSIFDSGGRKKEDKPDEKEAQLYEQIGRLKVEVDWLKKKSIEILKL